MPIYIGIDGGGTKTEAFLLDTDTKQTSMAISTASNPSTVGWVRARDTVLRIIFEVCKTADIPPTRLAGLCVGMAGVDRPQQMERMTAELTPHLPPECRIEIANDALPALTAGTKGRSGVVLISGTGSIAIGEDEGGHVVRAGGQGHLIGDEGSGFWVGQRGLIAALQYAEGRGPRTELWERAQVFFRIRSPEDIIAKIYDAKHPVGSVASFAKEVVTVCESGPDNVASRILDEASTHLVKLVASVHQRLPQQAANVVVLHGGLLQASDALQRRIKQQLPQYRYTLLRGCVSSGAALRAILQAGDAQGVSVWQDVSQSDGRR